MLLLDKDRMKQLIKSFYSFTGMATGVLDLDGVCITGHPENTVIPFCKMMRKNKAFDDACWKCDRDHFLQCKQSGQTVLYTCHAGLTEMISPVQKDGVTLCYMQLGQALIDSTAQLDRMHIYQHAHEVYGADGIELVEAINNLPTISEEKLMSFQTLFEAITLYLYSTRVVALSNVEFLSRLDEYVDHHLDQRIQATDLCNYFHMSRTQFYETVRSHLQIPLTTYIRNKRIRKAQELLMINEGSITAVAQAVGFDDYSYFCHVFKQVTGSSPRSFRQEKGT
ncbi:MAG: helix-turn-helix domain-containing protein [Clostridiales bacterium]|nr:helix-turn-helix domain-containing protein [Clostridiales bacterium]